MNNSQLTTVLGITSYNDSKKEEMIYSLGKPHYMPISLFLSLMSSYKKSSFRIFNLVASTFSINSAKLTLPDLNKDILDKMKEQFDENYQEDYSFIKRETPIDYSADYKEVELWNYVDMWNNFLNMATPLFETDSEYAVLCCPPDFIRFRNRSEFSLPKEQIERALIHIVGEVSHVMKKTNFNLSQDGYLIYIENYNPLTVSDSYAF